jgi:ubiquinone/menaquinone biosynthesis C-methylase UbiE
VINYDEVAPQYDAWRWQRFWDLNEVPFIEATFAHGPILDAGTGTGRYVEMLRRRRIACFGVDQSTGMLGVATHKSDCAGSIVRADVRALPFALSAFSGAIAARVLCHLEVIESPLVELARVVRSGGQFVVTELDPEHAFETTRVPTSRGRIAIETWKRSADEIARTAQALGWRDPRITRVRATDCAWLPGNGLSSIDRSGGRVVFYVLQLTRA